MNTPIYCSVFLFCVHACVARCSASCVNGAFIFFPGAHTVCVRLCRLQAQSWRSLLLSERTGFVWHFLPNNALQDKTHLGLEGPLDPPASVHHSVITSGQGGSSFQTAEDKFCITTAIVFMYSSANYQKRKPVSTRHSGGPRKKQLFYKQAVCKTKLLKGEFHVWGFRLFWL